MQKISPTVVRMKKERKYLNRCASMYSDTNYVTYQSCPFKKYILFFIFSDSLYLH